MSNEQAFPRYPAAQYEPGMTLRDYFAAHAPAPHEPMQLEDHCAYRYRYADAMLKAREAQ